ncbi:MAG: energy transducer TonB [Elusimicrobiota bacterium]|nr:energy transducer TonB [Elusimicrobiota bacterium]
MPEATLPRGVLLSAALHAVAATALWGWFHTGASSPIVADLDLSFASLAQAAPNPGGGRALPAPAWTAPARGPAPAPSAAEPVPAAPPEAEAVPQAPCAAPCAENGGGGGTGEGRGVYIPAAQTARKPRWLRNFIGPQDYPRVAREAGKDGRVVLTVMIDEEGKVRDARLLHGAYGALNEVALRKVRKAIFAPAYDKLGQAVACEVTLPIRFELRGAANALGSL